MRDQHTWISNTDLDISAHKLGLSLVQRLLQAFRSSELDVAEALWLAVYFVLHYANGGNLAISQEFFNICRRDIVIEVAEMGSIRWLGGKRHCLTIEPRAVYKVLVRSLRRLELVYLP